MNGAPHHSQPGAGGLSEVREGEGRKFGSVWGGCDMLKRAICLLVVHQKRSRWQGKSCSLYLFI